MKGKKFQDFLPVTKEDWIDQAQKDLKGGDFEKQQVSLAEEGFPISPYYAVEDVRDLQWIKNYHNSTNPVSDIPGSSPRHWTNAVEVRPGDDAALNEEIRLVLQNGADGLIIPLSEETDLDTVFKDVLLPYIDVWIRPKGHINAALKAFPAWVQQQDLDPADLHGGILWDGLAVGFQKPIQLDVQLDQAFYTHQLFKAFPAFRSICLATTIYPNAGGTSVQELGYGLAALVELLDGLTERGAGVEELYSDLFIFSAVGSDYFMEIAKLKVFRIALSQLAELYGVNLQPEEINLFSVSSQWSKSTEEAHNNLLRNTTEAMSAIIGGCNVLFVEAHDKYSQDSGDFSKRMARNISNILKEEAYFDKVIDPAAGSYYIENLTDRLYTKAIDLLTSLEAYGGWWQAYANHHIQDEIKEMRRKKISQLQEGDTRKVGLKPQAFDQINILTEERYQLKPMSHDFLIGSSL